MKSKKPDKQRKRMHNLPDHKKRKLLSSSLSKELREKYEKRSFPVRKGDVVEVVRGDKKGETGEVQRVDKDGQKIYIEDVVTEKSDKSETMTPIHPSNLVIKELNLEDQERREALNR